MSDKTYNGWTNYETWNVKLWMDNDQGSYNYWQERTREIFESATPERPFTRAENAKLELARQLEAEHDDIGQNALEASKMECSWVADLLHGALSEVNWHEIADALLTDHVEEYSKAEETEAA